MKKDKDAMNCWSEANEATLVHTLASEKAKSNWGNNGPKKVAWTACEATLRGSEKTSGGSPKTPQSIKNQWQWIKQEFETVKELRGLLGFGWEDAKKTVMATDKVWEAYLAFPLYNNIVELVNGTRATGANTIQFGQTPGSSHARAPTPPPLVPIDPVLLDQSKGKNKSYGGIVPLIVSRCGFWKSVSELFSLDFPASSSASSDSKSSPSQLRQSGSSATTSPPLDRKTDVLALNQAIAPGPAPKEPRASFFEGDKYNTSEDDDLIKMPASPEPPKRKCSKSVDPKTKDKKQRIIAGEGMSNVSSSMHNVADSVHTAVMAKLNTPQVFVIKAIEKDKGLTCFELASVVECVMGDTEFANAYLAVGDAGVCALILRCKLKKLDSRV
ncbi:hypothetical protein EDB84DRAFT_1559391 [Lactarius hengduanensis]|nr:hypothetical protein EDB84DRAFT_1559391 [Lactarius hengduanensis]